MYSARDVTSTVENLGLITSSIISKKVAEGISCLVLDVKWGKGSFNKTLAKAEELAASLKQVSLSYYTTHFIISSNDFFIQTSASLGVATSAVISHMESPLGKAIGNSLEVAESLACLRGEGPKELRELVVLEGAMLLVSANMVSSLENGKKKIEEVLDNGKALNKFKCMLIKQVF